MGKIPEFQRQRLASGVVGTAGVDVSHEALFEQASAISRTAEKAAFALNEKRNKAVDGAETNKLILEFERDIDANIIEKQNSATFLDHPDDIFDVFLAESQAIATAGLEFASNDRVKSSFANLQQQVIRNRMASLQKWASDTKVVKAAEDFTSSLNIASSSAFQTDNLEDIVGEGGFLDRLDQTASLASSIYGVKGGAQAIQEGREAIVKGYLQGQIQRNPFEARHVLDNEPEFQKILSISDRKSLNNDIRLALKTFKEKNIINTALTGFSQNRELANKFMQDDLTVTELDDLKFDLEDEISSVQEKIATGEKGLTENISVYEDRLEYISAMRDMVLKGTSFDAEDDAISVLELYNEWNQLYNKERKRVKGTYLEALRFQIKAAKLQNLGKITKSKFLEYADMLSNTLINKVGDFSFESEPGLASFFSPGQKGDKPTDALNNGFKVIWSWFEANRDIDNWNVHKADALSNYITQYDKRSKSIQADLADNEAFNLAQTEINKQVQQINPAVLRAGEKGQLFKDPQGNEAIVFPDGRIEEIK